ncbi:SPOR domain-containing protein [Limimaricola pyoseonensis]|nr:SPOR domain-containing protein [Limimaricola pyoseonensis]
MIRTFLAASAAAAAMAVAGQAVAQDDIPAEFPPESYEASQYVDSRGCAFIRAGVGGVTNWVPRMNREREPLCGFEPSRVAAAEPVADPAPKPETRPEPARAAPRPAPVTPRVVSPRPAPAAPLTLAAFCADRSGPQPGYVGSRTGRTIDCGPGPDAAMAMPDRSEPLRGRVTLAEVCADMAATGRRYRHSDSGAPVNCAPAAGLPVLVAGAAGDAAPAGPDRIARAAQAAGCDLGAGSGYGLIGARRDLPLRCGPQAQSPSGRSGAGAADDALAFRGAAGVAGLARPLPEPSGPPPGYRAAWQDDRLNPARGVRLVEREGAGQVRAPLLAAPVTVPQGPAGRVSTKAVPQAAIAGRFVQVGTYAEPENAARAAARLRAMQLPVAHGRLTRGGAELQVVATGPFEAGALDQALGQVRAAGYPDAFVRR